MHPDDLARWRQVVGAAIAQRAPFDVEYRANCFDGRLRTIRVQGSCESGLSEQRSGLSLAGISRDTTALTNPEETWHPFAQTLERSSHFVMICDLLGRPYYANQTALKWSGVETVADFSPHDLQTVLGEEADQGAGKALVDRAIRTGSAAADTYYRSVRGRTSRPVRMNLAVLNQSGRQTALAAIGQERLIC